MSTEREYFSIKEASKWATDHLGKTVTTSNISYLVQYGLIKKYGDNGNAQISVNELQEYYKSYNGNRESDWKQKLGDDLNWELSFQQFKEAETTKHVHRLHPYKGKFIPQLVEYFIDDHTDKFKKEVYFKKGDIILDPFAGSGTTLVQSSESGMHAIGIDISAFNSLISNCKVSRFNLKDVQIELNKITDVLKSYLNNSHIIEFDNELLEELSIFNSKYFPVPDYKYKLRRNEIDEDKYGSEKEELFLKVYNNLLNKYKIEVTQRNTKTFLDKWYLKSVREEIEVVFNEIKKINNLQTKKLVSIILSRTIRSCRATTHADLATLKGPISSTYYCGKHGKVCKPLFSILKWWESYSNDTIKRIKQFEKLKTNTYQYCLTGDSRTINIFEELTQKYESFGNLASNQKIKGIFSSPPYVGLIDYHEQHAYAYDLFGFDRKDELEIGPLFKGQGKEAKESYVNGISEVLINCKKYLAEDFYIFLVANDKYNLYPTIAEKSGLKIVNQFKRPVINRTEKVKGAYSEIIFHLKNK
ncbi:MAG: DNA methyltransferase [Ignavibacteria bacterium]